MLKGKQCTEQFRDFAEKEIKIKQSKVSATDK